MFIIIIIGLCLGIYGILQYYGIDFRVWDRDIGRQRVMGQFGNVNYFAEYIILPLSLTFGLILSKNKIYNRLLLLLALLAMGGALFFTFTRGSYLAIVVTISLILFLYFKSVENEQTKHFYKKAILLFLLFIIIVLALIYIPHPLNREGTALGKLKSRTTIEVLISGSSTLRRLAIWKCTWMMIEDYPILGSGLGTYAYHTLKYQAEFFSAGNNRDIYPYGNAAQAHNEYLQLWSELGIVGLLFFVCIIFTYYRNILKNVKGMDEKEKTITIGLVGGVTAVLIDAMFGFPLQLSASMSLFWIFLGLTISQTNVALESKKDKATTKNGIYDKKGKITVKGEGRGISFHRNHTKKGIAYTMVIVLVIICF
ncbi:MAG: O-antigen ligase family protein, partial [Bacteroidales bacterium]|nr:O-antigen ligase family protein [Bacteroidales bacterium]